MAPDTRPPLSHLRPTLSTRLRRSFDGKRSKTSETTTLNGDGAGSPGLGIDPEVLRNAVEQAIMGESFQKAIAANLANIVKPAIKSALDTIQPVIEAVYSHDLLLRKTNKSVERLLDNMDTIAEEDEGRPHERSPSAGSFYDMEFKALLEKSNKRTVATLAELSNAVQSNTYKLASLETSFGQMKENTASLFATHGNKLDLMALFITELKDQSEVSEKLESVSGELNGIRASVDAGTGMNNGGFVELGAKLNIIVSTAEAQAGYLDAIKHSTAKAEILAAIQNSHDYHDGRSRARSLVDASANMTTASNTFALQEIKTYLETHSTVLGEIKERSLIAPPEVTTDDTTSASLQEIKTYLESHSTVLGEIKEKSLVTPTEPTGDDATSTTLQEIKTYLATHSTVLDELKERPSPAPLDTSSADTAATLQELKTYLEAHSTAFDELKERTVHVATNGEDTSATLQDILLHLDTQSTVLGEIKERSIVPESPYTGPDTASSLQDIKTHLETHSTTLEDIKERSLSPPTLDTTDIITSIDAIKSQLESHHVLLGDIKEVSQTLATTDTSSAEITSTIEAVKVQLESLKEIIEAGHGSNNEIVGGLGSKIDNILVTIEGHKPTDFSAEILAALQKSNDSHESHSTALDGMKSLIVVPSPTSDPTDLTGVESQLTRIITTLETHTSTLSELNAREITPPPFDEALNLEVNSITTTLETHTRLLNEIKDNVSAEILTALHDMGQTQTLHSATLSELRDADMSDEVLTALHTSNEAHSGHQAEFEKLHGAVRGFNERYEKHGADLEEIKSRSLEVPVAPEGSSIEDLETKIVGIVSILEEQNSTLSSIQSSTQSAVESHSAHSLSFNQIHSRSLEPLPVVEKFDTSELEAKIAGIASVLEEQNVALSSIKEGTQSAVDSHFAHAVTLGDIHSRFLEPAPVAVVEGVSNAELEVKIAAIVTILEEQKTELSSIKQSTDSALESHSAHAVSLGEINSRSLETPSAPEGPTLSDLELKIAAIVTILEGQKVELTSIKQSTESALESHSAHTVSLGEINSRSLEIPSAPEGPTLSDLELKIATMAEVLEQQMSTLADIHTSATSALESHASHAVSLGEMNTRSLEDHATDNSALLEAKINGIVEILEQQSSTLSEIHISANSAVESHATHTLSLDDIKTRSLEPVAEIKESPILQELQDKIVNIISILEEQTDALSILKESSNAGIDSHTSALDEIKASNLVQRDLHDSHATALAEIKDVTLASKDLHDSHSATLADLVIAAGAANESHASHSSTLAELKAIPPPPAVDLSSLTALETDLKNILETLSTHTTSLSEINTSSSTANPELFASIKESHDLLSTHTTLLDSINSSSSTSHEELLTNLTSLKFTLEDTKSDIFAHTASLSEISTSSSRANPELLASIKESHNLLSAHTTLLDSINTSSSTSHEELLTNLTSLKSTLEDTKSNISAHTATLSEINTLSSTANPEVLSSIKDSHDLLSTHTVLLDSLKSSSLDSHEEVLANLKNVHSALEDTKSDISAHGSLVKNLHSETKDSHSSLTTALSALALGGVAGAGVGFLASRNSDDDVQLEESSEPIVERAITPTLVEDNEIDAISEVPELVEEPIVERSITPVPKEETETEDAALPVEEALIPEVDEVEEVFVERAITPESSYLPEMVEEDILETSALPTTVEGAVAPAADEADDNVVERDVMPPAAAEELKISIPENPEEDIAERSPITLHENESPIPEEFDNASVEELIIPVSDIVPDSDVNSVSAVIEESDLERSTSPLSLEHQSDSEPLTTIEDVLLAEDLPLPISETEVDLDNSPSAHDMYEPIEESLSLDMEEDPESSPVVDVTNLSSADRLEDEPVSEIIASSELPEPLVARLLSQDLESKSIPDDETETARTLPVEDTIEEETPALPAVIIGDEPLVERSVTPVEEIQNLEPVLPLTVDEQIIIPSTISSIQEESNPQGENLVSDNKSEISNTSIDDDPIPDVFQDEEELPIEKGITPVHEIETTEYISPFDALDNELSVTPSLDYDSSKPVEQSDESPIDQSITSAEEDMLHTSEVISESAAESIEPTAQEDSKISPLPIADRFTSDRHNLPEFFVSESSDLDPMDEFNETSDDTPPTEESPRSAQDNTLLDQSDVEPSILESQELEATALTESSPGITSELCPLPVENEMETSPIPYEVDSSFGDISLELSTTPVVDPETAEHEEVVARDVTIHHHITILPPIVVEINTEQETVLDPEYVEVASEVSTPAAALESNGVHLEERGLSPEAIIEAKTEDDDILPKANNEVSPSDDFNDLTEEANSTTIADLDTTVPTTVTDLFEGDDPASLLQPADSVVNMLPTEVKSSSQSDELTTASTDIDRDSNQTPSDVEIEHISPQDTNERPLIKEATQLSDSIDLAEQVDQVVPDFDDDQKSEKALSDAGSETTAIQHPIELAGHVDQSLPDVDNSIDSDVPAQSSESLVAQIIAQSESQSGAKDTSQLNASPSLPMPDEDILNEENGSSSIMQHNDHLFEREIESRPTSPFESQRVNIDTQLANYLGEDTTRELSPTLDDSTVSRPTSPLLDDDQDELTTTRSEVSNNDHPLPSVTNNEQPGLPSETPRVEDDIVDAYLSAENKNSPVEQPDLDEEEPLIDSDHVVTQSDDRDDDVMSVMSSDDVVSPSEWMFRSSHSKPRNFSQNLEATQQNSGHVEDVQPSAEALSDHGPSTPLAFAQATKDSIAQDYFPAVVSTEEDLDNFESSTLTSTSGEDRSTLESVVEANHHKLPGLEKTISSETVPRSDISSPFISKPPPNENDVLDSELNAKDTTPTATLAQENSFPSDLTHAAASSDTMHSPVDEEPDFEIVKLLDESTRVAESDSSRLEARDEDFSPILSPVQNTADEVVVPLSPLKQATEYDSASLSSSPVLTPVDKRVSHVEISSPVQSGALDSSPVLSPVDDHFQPSPLFEQEHSLAASSTYDGVDERYKRPPSADPYDDEDMVVEWSGKDENTISLSAAVDAAPFTPSKEASSVPNGFEEGPAATDPKDLSVDSAPNEPSSPSLLPSSLETAPEKSDVFQFQTYEDTDHEEAFSPIDISKGKEPASSPPPPLRRKTTEEELAAWMPVDLDKRYSQVEDPMPEAVSDNFGGDEKGGNEKEGQILSPSLPEQTVSEPTTPATPGFGVEDEPLSPASGGKKAAGGGGKKKKGKKGKK